MEERSKAPRNAAFDGSWRLSIRALIIAVVALIALPASSAFAGNLIATGHDIDDHRGSNEQEHFTQVAINFAKGGAPDKAKPVLAISCAGQMTGALDDIGVSNTRICPSADPAAFNALALSTAKYSAIAVGSSCTTGGVDDDINLSSGTCSTPGGSTPDSDLLNARSADIAAFFNQGGGLLYAAGNTNGDGDPSTGPDTYYSSVPLGLGGKSVSPPFTLTPEGKGLGFEDSTNSVGTRNDINCCPTHNSFREPPAGGAVKIAERDSTGAPETLFAGGTIRGGAIVSDDDPLPEALLCGRRTISLVRADRRGKRVVLLGLVAKRLAGQRVTILANYGGGKLTTVKPDARGVFRAVVRRPSRRFFTRARYRARVKKTTSRGLKLFQALRSTGITQKGSRLVLRGKVERSLLGRRKTVVIKRLACGGYRTVGKARPNRRGRYVVRFKAPDFAGVALYRAQTRVLARPRSGRYVRAYARALVIRITDQTG